MLRRHVPQTWNQAGFLLVACVFFYAAFRTAFPSGKQQERHGDWVGGRGGKGIEREPACSGSAHDGEWASEPSAKCQEAKPDAANCGEGFQKTWQWHSQAISCGAKRRTTVDLSSVLADKWVAVIGDSIGRMLFAAMLRLLGDGGDYPIHKAHQDFEYNLPENLRASFFWSPYPTNASDLLLAMSAKQDAPTFVIISVGLWHMLHVTSARGFSQDLKSLQSAAQAFTAAQLEHSSHANAGQLQMSICSISDVQHEMLVAEDKRQRMTRKNVQAYNDALMASGLLAPTGLFSLLDVHGITVGCGASCSEDGIHYHNATYDVMAQTWANLVLQRLQL